MSYWRFGAMITTSTVVMFGLMYLNTFAIEHVFWSQTRAWMAVIMGATMAVIMLTFMLAMYKRRGFNFAIFGSSVVAFALALWLVRSQATVDDDSYMMAMIPHHSIAIMTSNRAQISDPGVRKLADEIVAAQNREIAEMRYLIGRDPTGDETALIGAPEPAPIATSDEAILGAHIPTLDPGPLSEAEITNALGEVSYCSFRYTKDGAAIVAFGNVANGNGVVALNGYRVILTATDANEGISMSAGQIRLTMSPEAPLRFDGTPISTIDSELVFSIGDQLRVGYVGYVRCD